MADRSPATRKSFGHYRIQGQLGAGGMGVVYSAYDTVLERKVAIKVVGDRVLPDKPARDLLLHEARAASSLNHPNICTIHEVGDSDGETYIVMEQVEGLPLSSLLGTNGLSPDLVVRYGLQIADALAHAHAHGVIHRDLKSTNVVVTPEGRVKVLDFGLAARLRDAELQEAVSAKVPLTESRMIVGTLPYLAPELLRGEPAEARTDTWALGVLLYEMASTAHPFYGRTAFELSSAILRDAPAPRPATVPSNLSAVIVRCLEKSPGDRYQQASEVRSALEALPGFLPVLPPSDGSEFRITRWLLLTMSLLILALGFAFNWRGSRDWLFHHGGITASPVSVSSASLRKSVAVLGFRNASKRDETAWLSTALSEMLATELSAGEKLRIIPPENVARMERDLSLAETDSLASDNLNRVHNYLGSDLMLGGSYTALGTASGGQLRLDVRLEDATTGETIASVAEAGSEINLFDLGNALASLGDLRSDEGDLAGAKQMHLESLAVAQEVHATPDIAGALMEIGDDQIAFGDAAGALVKDREAVELARQFGGRGALAEILAHIARAFYLRGDLRSAKQSIQESLDIARQINNKSHIALALTNSGEILMAEGDLPQARKNLEDALRIRTEIEQKNNAAGTRLQLATLSIEDGHAAEAEHIAREVRDEYRKEEHPDDEIGAYVVLLRALHAENKSDDAQKEVGDAKLLQAKSQNVYNRLAIRIVDAQIEAASGT